MSVIIEAMAIYFYTASHFLFCHLADSVCYKQSVYKMNLCHQNDIKREDFCLVSCPQVKLTAQKANPGLSSHHVVPMPSLDKD